MVNVRYPKIGPLVEFQTQQTTHQHQIERKGREMDATTLQRKATEAVRLVRRRGFFHPVFYIKVRFVNRKECSVMAVESNDFLLESVGLNEREEVYLAFFG